MSGFAKTFAILTVASLAGAAAMPCLGQSLESSAASGRLSWSGAMASAQALVARTQAQDKLNDELYEAAIQGRENAVVSLIKQGADVNAVYTPSVGNRPLDGAVIFGDNVMAVAKTLVLAGADINSRDFSGMTPLTYAILYGRAGLVRMFLGRFRRRVDAANIDSALVEAAKNGDAGLVRTLLADGADPNARSGSYESRATALMLAASIESGAGLGIIKTLISARADVNARDAQGNTALMYAAQFSSPGAARLLLAAGADPLARNDRGQTARDIAQDIARRAAAHAAWCRRDPVACND